MFTWIKTVFSEDSAASFARCATAVTVSTGCGCLVHVVRHNHAFPEATILVALGAWMTSPYAINKFAVAWGKNGQPADDKVGGLQASADRSSDG